MLAPRRVRYAERHATQDVKPLKSKCLEVGSPSSMTADRPPAGKLCQRMSSLDRN